MSPQSRHAPGSYFSEDTIAAISTALGGAVAIVRVSGPRAFAAVEALSGASSAALAPRKLGRARLRAPDGSPLDDALVVCFPGPGSFTGEDVAELHIHGGAYVATRVMEALGALGARQALAGEFSFRAVRNGKFTIPQAEAIADLISAANDGAVALALEKMSGTQSRLIAEIAEGVRHLTMMGEVGIDFNDQDLDEVSLPTLKTKVAPLIEKLARLRDSYGRGVMVQDGIRVAFIGLPNAGKSSFFNALLGEERSIVSEIAGTTRDVVRERLTLRGSSGSVTLRLEDTAGLRAAGDRIEKIGVERSLQSAKEADLILFLVDPTAAPEAVRQEWARLGSPAERSLGLVTKSDLLTPESRAVLEGWRKELGIGVWRETSARNGAGISEAAEAIVEFCEKWVARDPNEVLLTRLDHLTAVKQAIADLERAQAATEIDLFAADLRQCLHALSPLIGTTVPDDILGQIFSQFCIGK